MIDSAYKRGDYDWLYANYLGDGHDSLSVALRRLLMAKPYPKVVLDLCAGTGHFTRELVDAGLRVVAVDKSEAMLRQLRHKVGLISALELDLNAPEALDQLPWADLITCRQGAGYLSPRALSIIPSRLKPGGIFLFNAFAEPTSRPWLRKRPEGIYEAGVYLAGRVFHLQARWPRVDLTTFYWHDIEGPFARTWRRLGFDVDIQQMGRTLIVTIIA